MAVVLGGLGQPERGSLAAFGLGAAESDPNAMRAALSGSCSITATLTADGASEPVQVGGGRYYMPAPDWLPPMRVAAPMAAHLSGTSSLTASLDFTIDTEALVSELVAAMILDLV